MRVRDWLDQFPGRQITVGPDATVDEMIPLLSQAPHARDIYVVEGDKVVGHLSHRRLASVVLAEHRPVRTRRQLLEHVAGGVAKHLMDSAFARAHLDEDLDDVLSRQLDSDVEDLPVLDDGGSLVGTINLTQVLQYFLGQRSGSSP